MSIVKGEWADINVIASEAANKNKSSPESSPFLMTACLENDLKTAINILNEAGFTVVREIKEEEETIKVIVSAIADVPKGLEKETLINLISEISWYGKKIFKSGISAKILYHQ